MKCSHNACKNLSSEEITCETCYLPKYCSDSCKTLDFDSHSLSCKPASICLKEYIPVNSYSKIIGTGTYAEVQLMRKTDTKALTALKIINKLSVSSLIPLKVLFREIIIHKSLNQKIF